MNYSFDALARALAAGDVSRRQAVKRIGGALGGAALAYFGIGCDSGADLMGPPTSHAANGSDVLVASGAFVGPCDHAAFTTCIDGALSEAIVNSDPCLIDADPRVTLEFIVSLLTLLAFRRITPAQFFAILDPLVKCSLKFVHAFEKEIRRCDEKACGHKGQQCASNGVCCPRDSQVCGPTCCAGSTPVCQLGMCVAANTCPPNSDNCGLNVVPSLPAMCCCNTGFAPCASGSGCCSVCVGNTCGPTCTGTLCGTACCDFGTPVCCNGACFPRGTTCCGGVACLPGESCCSNNICCSSGQKCVNGQCTGTGCTSECSICCGGTTCCAQGEGCINGVCAPITMNCGSGFGQCGPANCCPSSGICCPGGGCGAAGGSCCSVGACDPGTTCCNATPKTPGCCFASQTCCLFPGGAQCCNPGETCCHFSINGTPGGGCCPANQVCGSCGCHDPALPC